MRITFSRWGNSLAVRISSAFARDLGVSEGDQMELALEGGRLVLRPLEPRYDLEALVAGITRKNRTDELGPGGPAGGEEW